MHVCVWSVCELGSGGGGRGGRRGNDDNNVRVNYIYIKETTCHVGEKINPTCFWREREKIIFPTPYGVRYVLSSNGGR